LISVRAENSEALKKDVTLPRIENGRVIKKKAKRIKKVLKLRYRQVRRKRKRGVLTTDGT
jgi:hypothetical protein